MRSFAINGATLVVAGLLGAGLGACSDGSGGLTGTGGVDTGSSAGMASTAGGGTVVPTPTAGTGPVTGTAGTSQTSTGGTGPNPGTGGATDAGTGGTPVVTTAGTGGTGGTGGSGTAGTGTGTAGSGGGGGGKSGPFKVLIISTALEFAHDSIPDCQALVSDLGKADPANQWTTKIEGDDLADFTATGLADYGMIFSCSPTGRVFSGNPKVKDPAGAMTALQNFIEKDGKGFAGVHSASDFEKTNGFPWFTNTLMGGYFQTHDNDGTSGSVVADTVNKDHPVLAGLSGTFSTQDEWYKMNRDIAAQPGFKILQRLGADQRPLTWVKDVGTGRMFYTVRGHNKARFKEEPFRTLVKNGIYWVMKRTG
jgi:type 1 glutamine amidotransferase